MEAPNETIVIRGGRVLDGTGAEAMSADVRIAGDRIEAVGEMPARTGEDVIDAAGAFVAPGFINMHGHSDLTALTCADAANRVLEGVTTEVSGQCGHSVFPIAGQGREHIEPDAERHGVDLTWSDFDGYARRLEASGSSVHPYTGLGFGSLPAPCAGGCSMSAP
jgi:N-acyl-D-aspartate/D-glutamate deacylase